MNHLHTIACVKVFNFDEQTNKRKFLKLLGGQCHVRGATREAPLVRSRGNLRCPSCKRRQDFYCCSTSSCGSNACKKCFDAIDENEIHFQQEICNETASSTLEESFSSDSSSMSESDSDAIDGEHQLFQSTIPQENSSDDLLGMCNRPDVEDDDVLSVFC